MTRRTAIAATGKPVLASYRMTDTSGTTATDSSGNGRNGTYTNTPTLNQPSLDPSDSDPSMGMTNNGGTSVVVTSASWMNVNYLSVTFLACWTGLLDGSNGDAGVDRYGTGAFDWNIWRNTNGRLRIQLRNAAGNTYDITSPFALSSGQTYDMGFSFDGTTLRLFCNGTEVASTAVTGTMQITARNIEIGMYSTSVNTTGAGFIDEVDIIGGSSTSDVLTLADIEDIYVGSEFGVWRRDATSGAPGAATSFTPTMCNHIATNRILLLVTGKSETTTIPTAVGGSSWTLLKSGTGGTGSLAADTGQVFWALFGLDAASGAETAPTITPGGTAPNSWNWIMASYQLPPDAIGWLDSIGTSAAWVQSGSDTNTASPLSAAIGSFSSGQPTARDAIALFGSIPTDLGTAVATVSASASGLSGGKTTAPGVYQENPLGFDTAAFLAEWVEFDGTASGAVTPSFTVTSSTNHSGVVIGVALRASFATPTEDLSIAATVPQPTMAVSLSGFNDSDITAAATVPKPTMAVSLSGFNDSEIAVAASVPQPVMAASFDVGPAPSEVTIDGAVPVPVMAVLLDSTEGTDLTGAFSVLQPTMAVSLEGFNDSEISIDASVPQPTLAVSLDVEEPVDDFICLDLDTDVQILWEWGSIVDGEIIHPPTGYVEFLLPTIPMVADAVYELRVKFSGGRAFNESPDPLGYIQVNLTGENGYPDVEDADWYASEDGFGPFDDPHIFTVGTGIGDYDTAIDATGGGPLYAIIAAPHQSDVLEICWRQTVAPPGGMVVPRPVLDLVFEVADVLPGTDTTNRAGGRTREGIGIAFWEPPVVVTPPELGGPLVDELGDPIVDIDGNYVYPPTLVNRVLPVAVSFTAAPIQTENRPTYTAVHTPALETRVRILVNGKDITYFRGVATPPPAFEYIVPLLYGPGTMILPQVMSYFEVPGEGSLSWLKPFARVVVQRIRRDNGTVYSTDWKGLIIGFDTAGRDLVCQLGGEASGLAAMRDQQQPVFEDYADIGHYAYRAIRDLGLPFEPNGGPVTGIEIDKFGGTGMLDYINQIVARGWTRAGNQWTIMPDEDDGKYRMFRKNTDVIHGTAYLDDARTVGSLVRDLTEEPNRIFMEGVTPEGRRYRFAVYPGLVPTKPAPYPMFDNSSFGEGTTNEDTDTGDGITLLKGRLQAFGYLKRNDAAGAEGTYTDEMTDAVKLLQEDIGEPETGDVDVTTWRALYDLDSTGYSLEWAHIEPASQQLQVKDWIRSASGSIMRANPDYDPSIPKVDRSINIGAGFWKKQGKKWAIAERHAAQTPNWVGSITFATGALVAGDHSYGDPVTPMLAKDLRPGMNLSLPTFMGGIVVHVTGVSIPGDAPVSITVDTRARDTLPVWEVIASRKETRGDPARAYVKASESSQNKDAVDVWDSEGGTLYDPVEIPANTWVTAVVVGGQEGAVRALEMKTSPAAEFVVAVTGKPIPTEKWDNLVGNPLASKSAWTSDSVRKILEDDHWLLYAAGTPEQPCGYSPGMKTDENGEPSGDPLTGKHIEKSGFSYYAHRGGLYVSFYADRDTVIPAGRIMLNQLDGGS